MREKMSAAWRWASLTKTHIVDAEIARQLTKKSTRKPSQAANLIRFSDRLLWDQIVPDSVVRNGIYCTLRRITLDTFSAISTITMIVIRIAALVSYS